MTSNPADMMPFSKLMGVIVTEATPDIVKGEMEVRPDLCTAGGILHGGAAMAFADALGGIGAYLTLPPGATGTTTIESKTNFLAAAKAGVKVYGEAMPVSLGQKISVWQTSIRREDGKQIALVTQSQFVLRPS